MEGWGESLRRRLAQRLGRRAGERQWGASGERALIPETMDRLGLTRQPFHDHAPAAELFTDTAIEMQLNALADQLRSGEMLPLLRGEQGAGKTCELISLMARSEQEFHFFVVRGQAQSTAQQIMTDMLRLLVSRVPATPSATFRELARQLRALVADGAPAVLVIDDADQIADEELNRLFALHDSLATPLGHRFRMLLSVHPDFELRLEGLSSEQLDAGRVTVTAIRPLQRPRVGPYLLHRLQTAGFAGTLPLSDEDLDVIAARAEGLPRGIEAAAADCLNERCAVEPAQE